MNFGKSTTATTLALHKEKEKRKEKKKKGEQPRIHPRLQKQSLETNHCQAKHSVASRLSGECKLALVTKSAKSTAPSAAHQSNTTLLLLHTSILLLERPYCSCYFTPGGRTLLVAPSLTAFLNLLKGGSFGESVCHD